MRDKNSAAAGTYFSNLSLFLFLGGEVMRGVWEPKGVCQLCHAGEYLGAAPRPGWRRPFIWEWGFFLFKKKSFWKNGILTDLPQNCEVPADANSMVALIHA